MPRRTKKGRPTRFPGVSAIGRYQFRIRAKWKEPNTQKKRELDRVIEARTAEEAAGVRAALLAEVDEGPPTDPVLRTFATSWIASKLPTLKPSTARHYADTLELHVLPVLGERRIRELTRGSIVAWRDAQTGRPATVNTRLRVLRTLLADASADLGIPSPAARVPGLPTERATDGSSKVLSPDELRELLEAVKVHRPQWYPMVLLLATTGMRWGAASALKWDDVDWIDKVIEVRRAHVRGRVGTPKTAGSVRALPLTDELVEVLRAHQRDLMSRQAPGFSDGWMFPSSKGTLMQPSSIRKPLAHCAVVAGMAEEIRDERGRLVGYEGRVPSAHWFRYTLNHLLRRSTAGIVQRAITGHVTEQMSWHYDRVGMEEKRGAVEGAFGLLDGGPVHRSGPRGGPLVPPTKKPG